MDSGFRLLSVLLVLVVGLAACGTDAEPEASAEDGLQYATTISPFAMILEPVVEGRATVVRLIDPSDSPHTYDPRPSDLRAVSRSAAFFYGADVLDGWATELPVKRRVALFDLVPNGQRMAFAPGEEHGHGSEAAQGQRSDDPHFWTDPLAVKALLPALVDTLCDVDASGCGTYRANADTFATELDALDSRLRTILRPVRGETVMLSQPFFRYFLRRYGFTVAGVVEPQPAKEPTPRQIHALVDVARSDGVRAILTQRQLPPRGAKAVAEASGASLLTLDPLGGTEGRTTYRTLLEFNATALRDGLQEK